MFKTRRQWTSSIGHEEGMEWRTKTFRTRGVVSERKMKMMIFHGTSLPQGPKVKKEEMFCADDEKDSFSWYITPTGSKAEERKKRCSALTIDGSRGSKGGGGCRGRQ